MREIARGDNFTIVHHHGHVTLTVIRRPDLTLEQGVEAGRQMFAALLALVDADADADADAETVLLMDLREAPIPGPRTRDALGDFLRRWIESGRRVGVVTQHGAMRMLYLRLLAAWQQTRAQCFDDLGSAEQWADAAPHDARDARSTQPMSFARPRASDLPRPRSDAHAAARRDRPASDPTLRTPSREILARGDNFTIHKEGQVAVLVVVRRPDLSLERGTENAREMFAQALHLAGNDSIAALVIDLSEAPVPGPNTRATLGELIETWERASRQLAVVVGHPAMRMLFERLVRMHAPDHGEVFIDQREARLWAAGLSRESITTTSGSFRSVPRPPASEREDD